MRRFLLAFCFAVALPVSALATQVGTKLGDTSPVFGMYRSHFGFEETVKRLRVALFLDSAQQVSSGSKDEAGNTEIAASRAKTEAAENDTNSSANESIGKKPQFVDLASGISVMEDLEGAVWLMYWRIDYLLNKPHDPDTLEFLLASISPDNN